MARTRDVVSQLLDGFNTQARKGRKVIRIKDNSDRTIGEVVIGKSTIRLNLRDELPENVELIAQAEGLVFAGKSDTWRGGGVRVTDHNVEALRTILTAILHDGHAATQVVTVRAALELLEQTDEVELDEDLADEIGKLRERLRDLSAVAV